MTTIEPHIQAYIDQAVNQSRKAFRVDMKKEIGILNEGFQHKLSLMGEVMDARVRIIVREEMQEGLETALRPIRATLDAVVEELHDQRHAIHR